MKLKLNLSRRQIVLLVAVAALVAWGLLTNRSSEDPQPGSLDEAATQACGDFTAGYPQARTKVARLALADRVMASSRRTGNDLIFDRVVELGRSANDSDAEWEASADALTSACRDAGWTAP